MQQESVCENAKNTQRQRKKDRKLHTVAPHACPADTVLDEDMVRLSPLIHEHSDMLGRYSFAVPEAVARGELRPLRIPSGMPSFDSA